MIKAIIFDMGSVFIDTSRFRESFAHEFKLKKGARVFPRKWARLAVLGKMPLTETYSFLSKKYNMPYLEARKRFIRAYSAKKIMQGMVVLVNRLKKQGYKLAVLSNTEQTSVQISRKRRYFRWFDIVVLSNDVKLRKPDRRIFLLTLRRLRMKPEECVFIDDHQMHVNAANRLGIRALRFRNTKSLIKDLRKFGVKV